MFASLGGFWFETVADLFAGSGILGIEALSRGASFATFVESNRAAASIIRANLEKSGFTDRSEVVARSVEAYFAIRYDSMFDLVLADPPYEYADLDGLVACLSPRDWPRRADCTGAGARIAPPTARRSQGIGAFEDAHCTGTRRSAFMSEISGGSRRDCWGERSRHCTCRGGSSRFGLLLHAREFGGI